eukprot:ANDGO_06762.mRNA.1 hypothetical protein
MAVWGRVFWMFFIDCFFFAEDDFDSKQDRTRRKNMMKIFPMRLFSTSNPKVEGLLQRYHDSGNHLFRRFWFSVPAEKCVGTDLDDKVCKFAQSSGVAGWVGPTPFLNLEGEVFGSLEQCNSMEQWLRSQGAVVPDDRRFLLRQRLFYEFEVIGGVY